MGKFLKDINTVYKESTTTGKHFFKLTMNIKSIITFASLGLFTTLTACSSPYNATRTYEVVGTTGEEQYSALVRVDMTAKTFTGLGDPEAEIDSADDNLEGTIKNAAEFIPPVPVPNTNDGYNTLLKEQVDAAITKQLDKTDEKSFGLITVNDVEVVSATNYVVGANKSFNLFMSQNEGIYVGGGIKAFDSDGDKHVTGSTNLVNVPPNRSSIVVLKCLVNGTGCEVDSNTESIPVIPNTGVSSKNN